MRAGAEGKRRMRNEKTLDIHGHRVRSLTRCHILLENMIDGVWTHRAVIFLLQKGGFYATLNMSAFRLHKTEKEVIRMSAVGTFLLSVAANVAAHCICKWLDEQFFMNGKH